MSQNPPEFTFERSAAWKGISPAKVLGSAVRARASGTLKIRIAKIVRQFVFHEGSVLLSTSNAKSELPGAFLQREGRFTPEQFNRYMEEISKTKESLWALAVRQAPLTPAEAVPLKAKYICEIAGTVFSAPAGDMEFQPGTAGFESAGPVHGVRFLIDAFIKPGITGVDIIRKLFKFPRILAPLDSSETAFSGGLGQLLVHGRNPGL